MHHWDGILRHSSVHYYLNCHSLATPKTFEVFVCSFSKQIWWCTADYSTACCNIQIINWSANIFLQDFMTDSRNSEMVSHEIQWHKPYKNAHFCRSTDYFLKHLGGLMSSCSALFRLGLLPSIYCLHLLGSVVSSMLLAKGDVYSGQMLMSLMNATFSQALSCFESWILTSTELLGAFGSLIIVLSSVGTLWLTDPF